MLAGAAANVMLPGSGVFVGAGLGAMMNKKSPIMGAISGGIGGYGGANLASGFMGAGEAAIGNQAMADVLGGTANVGPLAALNPADYAVSGDAFIPSASYGDALSAQKLAIQNATSGEIAKSGLGAAASNPLAFAKNNLGSLAAASAPLVSNMLQQQQPTLANLPNQNIPRQTYDYRQGTINPNFGQPGNKDPYFLDPGYIRTGAEGGLFHNTADESYPQARLPLQHMANGGLPPRYPWEVYGDADFKVSQKMPHSDEEGEGPYSNTTLDKNTPAMRVLATKKTTDRAKKLRALLRGEDEYVDYAAGGGLMGLNEYAAGGKLLRGAGDGMSDSIPAVIKGAKPQRAALADGEFVIPADVVSHLGNGSTEAGAKRLYSMMDKVRHARTGNPKQGKKINPDRFMPA
jgi:hypothetical protein